MLAFCMCKNCNKTPLYINVFIFYVTNFQYQFYPIPRNKSTEVTLERILPSPGYSNLKTLTLFTIVQNSTPVSGLLGKSPGIFEQASQPIHIEMLEASHVISYFIMSLHEYGHAEWTRTPSMDMVMQQGHGHEEWTRS